MKRKTPVTEGYLARLVERALPDTPLIRRRQPALFEPDRPWTGTRVDESFEETESPARASHRDADANVQRPPPPAPSQDAPTPPHEGAARVVEAARAPGEGRDTTTVIVRHETLHVQVPVADASIRRAEFDAAKRARATVPAPPAPPAAVPVQPARAVQPPAEARRVEPSPAVRPDPPRRVAPVVQPVPARAQSPIASRDVAERVRDAGARRAAQAAHPSMPHPVPRRAVRAAAFAPPQAPARELPPVEVTIGRVEVRAASAPAREAPRASRAAPRLSLDQYLRERTGGRS